MRKYRIIGSLLLLQAVMCTACNPDTGKKKISIAYANWLEGIAMSHLAKVVLEEQGGRTAQCGCGPHLRVGFASESGCVYGCLAACDDERLHGSVWRSDRVYR